VPAGYDERFRLAQALYPYAKGGAVTYMKPGQRIFDTRSRGGWYRGGAALKATLVRAGLPRTAPRVVSAPRSSSDGNLGVLLGVGAPGAALLAGAALVLAMRARRI
jgi:hypothetical protein